MTGYTVHTGSTEKFSTGWDKIFGARKTAKSTKKKSAAPKKTSAKKGAKKGPKRK